MHSHLLLIACCTCSPPPAPDVSPANFHITVLNSTAVEASWTLPTSRTGFNGQLRGFKIVVGVNGTERRIDIPDSTALAYIITDLQPATQHTFSMLMYTVADGPEGIHLRVMIPDSGNLVTIGLSKFSPSSLPYFLSPPIPPPSSDSNTLILFSPPYFSSRLCSYNNTVWDLWRWH